MPESPAKPRRRADPERARFDDQAVERPQFLDGFPDDPDLARVVAAFERGDYAHVRREARRLADDSESKRVRAAARELLRRIEPDPLAKGLLAAAALLLAFLVLWAYSCH
jgi:hypothetical protein